MGFGRATAVMIGFGTVLPDLTSRVPGLILDRVGAPDVLFALLDVGHMPLGSLLWSGLLAQAFEERKRAFALLATGSGLHYLLDVMQDHHGVGYRLWFPVSPVRWELGWFNSEATVQVALPLLLLTLVLWTLIERRRTAKLR